MTDVRQIGVVAADGSVAAGTGERCIDHAGHVTGDGFSVQANMMGSTGVWSAMAAAFEQSRGPLAHRLLAALHAGEAAGGDARGRMSAALLVVDGRPAERPGAGIVVDLRVDRSEDPLGDLAALLDVADAYAACERAEEQLIGGDPSGALATIDRALESLPGEQNLRLIRAGALLACGAVDAGSIEVRSLVAERPTWELIVRSLASKGLVPEPEGGSIDSLFG